MTTTKRFFVLFIAFTWIIFLVILQPHKRWGGWNDDEDSPQNAKTAALLSAPAKLAEPQIPNFITNSIGMEFVYIPPGRFMMGSPRGEAGRYDDRETQHEVTLTSGFYMQTTEVTQSQWESVVKKNPSYFKDCGGDCPVEQVSWNDVQEFVWKLNQMEKSGRYSLPTEAQWEYACKSGTTTRFNWGNEEDCFKANYGVSFVHHKCKGINPGKTMKVSSFPPNSLGLYDMHGNVWEWCLDRFNLYVSNSATDPAGAYAAVERVYRGGSWSVSARYCRSANRDSGNPNDRLSSLGFRLVREP
ncbi:formylglycine-generating enzyme family protein [Desulfonema magnum]|uniref:Sulfatase-modifying factor enzyme domain-containing protein n=1 Tax=Desulfonema magnum TaxID=45655 RepID=A0A975BUV6_9BACT|nr:formylglycine-generating enzyme family protein [Desulfonema magnum]QTA92196.1 Sulfatase-modifying factor enzyme domain-containing protein [Desulfonema magnum]